MGRIAEEHIHSVNSISCSCGWTREGDWAGTKLTEEESVILHELFDAAAQAHDTHSIPAGDYTMRTERLAVKLSAMISERST